MQVSVEQQRPLSFLAGCVVCVSGFNPEDKLVLKGMVEMCGGIYMDDMDCRTVTYLLSLTMNSEKAKHAVRWGVPVLSHQWLFDCIFERRFRSINDYLLH